jgi:hypothetical protein
MQPDKDRASHAYGPTALALAYGFCQLRSGFEPSLAHRPWHGRTSARAPPVEKRMLIHAASSLPRAKIAFQDPKPRMARTIEVGIVHPSLGHLDRSAKSDITLGVTNQWYVAIVRVLPLSASTSSQLDY